MTGKRPGNIEPSDGPDPFPKTGLVKQYEPFIRAYVGEFCQSHPGAIYEHALVDAVRIAVEFEAKFKPELGYDFSTPLRLWLKRLGREWNGERQPIRKPEGADKADEEADDAKRVAHRGGNGTRVTIDRQWTANRCRHRVLLGLQLKSRDEGQAREAIERMSRSVDRLLDDRPLTEIRMGLESEFGEAVDIQFPKPRKPPSHQWPTGMVFVSFGEVVGKDEDGNNLHWSDVVAGSDPRGFKNSETEVDKLLRAVKAEMPFFTPNERRVLEWKLDPQAGRLTHWAARNGIDKGYASRMNSKIESRLANRMKKI